MTAWLPYILLIVGFVVLVKGADWLVDGSSSLAARLKVSDLVIGLTVVAFGTSAPELFVNVTASLRGNTDIAIGNILGSNIANIMLILGVAAVIYPLRIQRSTTWKEIPFSLLAALAVGVMANDLIIDRRDPSALSRIDGIILLLFFCVFMYYVLEVAMRTRSSGDEHVKVIPLWKSIGLVVIGLAGLVLGGQWIVDGAVTVAREFGISEKLIGLTVVAIGTSLPELATTVTAAMKRSTDIAVGNVVGSNIFNLFLILGVSAIIRPLPFTPASLPDIGMTVIASLLLFLFIFIGQRHTIQRWQGYGLLSGYVLYILFAIGQG